MNREPRPDQFSKVFYEPSKSEIQRPNVANIPISVNVIRATNVLCIAESLSRRNHNPLHSNSGTGSMRAFPRTTYPLQSSETMRRPALRSNYPISICLFATLLSAIGCMRDEHSNPSTATLPNLSGLAWIEGDRFIGCQDAKVAGGKSKPRYASLHLATNSRGVTYRDAGFTFKGISPNDLESIAKVPGENTLLLCESGNSQKNPAIQNIFKARITDQGIEIVDVVKWPVLVHNVEATAVVRVGEKYIFIFAERASNQPSTQLSWLKFNPVDMSFSGKPQHVPFTSPDPDRYNRVIVGLDVDSDGIIYSVSSFDAEEAGFPNPDKGPFAGGIYAIGTVTTTDGEPMIQLFEKPQRLATVDGHKTESIAVRETNDGKEIFYGTDDENKGGVIRQLQHRSPNK